MSRHGHVRIGRTPRFPIFGTLLVMTLLIAVPAMVVTSTPALRMVQTLFGIVPEHIRIGEAQIWPRRDWALREAREASGAHARLWGVLPLPTPAAEDPYPKARFYHFAFSGQCEGDDVVLLEMSPSQAEPIRRLFELPVADVEAAGYRLGHFGRWHTIQASTNGQGRRFLMIPELRLSLGFMGQSLSPCVPPEVLGDPAPEKQDPLAPSAKPRAGA